MIFNQMEVQEFDLDEIKQIVASSAALRRKNTVDNRDNNFSSKSSLNSVMKGKSPYNSDYQYKRRAKKAAQKKILALKATGGDNNNNNKNALGLKKGETYNLDTAMDYLTATRKPPTGMTKSDFDVKSMTVAHQDGAAIISEKLDNMHKVSALLYNNELKSVGINDRKNNNQEEISKIHVFEIEKLVAKSAATIEETKNDNDKNTYSTSSSSINEMLSTWKHLKFSYPRFTADINVTTIDWSTFELRSDIWIARFFEECYNEAINCCYRKVGDLRKRKRCGLYLGALDSFPLVTKRLLERKYSTIEVRDRICVEIMMTLTKVINIGDNLMVGKTQGIEIDGQRAIIFSKFLSEEGDDPDVERLLEGFSFISGRIRQKLEDDLPEVSHSLINVLWPNYLRPVPSMSILEFVPRKNAVNLEFIL